MPTAELLKIAATPYSGSETAFEQAFSSLAYAYLRDKAPRLLDYMVGFQLVDRNEDNTKAEGVFGFKIGTQWLSAPVFFLNGDLKGHELLYMMNNDSFVPLKENWVNYIMSRKPHILGEESTRNLRELGGVYPDIRSLSIPPSIGGGKRASDAGWLEQVLPMMAAFKIKAANSLYRGVTVDTKLNQKAIASNPYKAALAKYAAAFDLNKVVPTNFDMLTSAYALTQKYPAIKQAMHKFYGADCFSRWGAEVQTKVASVADSIIPVSITKPNMPGSLLIPLEKEAAPVDHIKEGKLRIYVQEFVYNQRAPELDDAERERLLFNPVLIKDHRKGEQVSRVYNTQIEAKLTNPSETALYRVLEKPAAFSKMLIAMNGISNRGREPLCTVVRLGEGTPAADKAWLNAHPTQVFCDQISEKSEWDEWFKSLPDSSKLSENGEYIGIDDRGSCTVPFRIQSDYGDGRYRVDFLTQIDYLHNRASTMPGVVNRNTSDAIEGHEAPSTYGAMLYIDKEGKRGTKARAIAGELRLPADFKFISLQEPQEPSPGEIMPCCGYNSRSDMPPIQLGKIDDIHLLFQEKTAALQVYNNGTHATINSKLGSDYLSVRDALINLVVTHGLPEKVAQSILDTAEKQGSAKYRISYADSYGTEKAAISFRSILEGGPDAPIYDSMADERSVENYGPRRSARTQFGSEIAYRLGHLSAKQTDPKTYDPWSNYEAEDFQKTVQTAQQAGSQGQKEVFDTTMIAGMLKSVRQESIVEQHLGPLMEALDSLGRLLMNFYWHQEEFEDRYGKSDLPELEDGLRNSFEALGDITLFLKKKTVESPFDEGDISLDETARN